MLFEYYCCGWCLLQTDGVKRILETLAIIKKVGSKDNKPIWLDFTYSNVDREEITDYIESKSLENVLELHYWAFKS